MLSNIKKLMGALILFSAPILYAKTPLIMMWSGETSPPFHISSNEGILPDVAKAIAEKLSVDSQLVKIPRKRFEETLIKGLAHVYCKANPAWFRTDPNLDWSKPIYREKNIIVSKKEHAEKKL